MSKGKEMKGKITGGKKREKKREALKDTDIIVKAT